MIKTPINHPHSFATKLLMLHNLIFLGIKTTSDLQIAVFLGVKLRSWEAIVF